MILTLLNGYPFPYPANLTSKEEDALSCAAVGSWITLHGVTHFEWLHELTVEFSSRTDMEAARLLFPEWREWGNADIVPILAAPTSSLDGYGHPAIIAGGMAYCGIMLSEEK